MKKQIMALCAGRHEMPAQVEDAIFQNEVDVFDFDGMHKIVHSKLQYCNELDLYVTGLTTALIEVVNYCVYNDIVTTLYHFDRESGEYKPQKLNIYNYNCWLRGIDGDAMKKKKEM